MTQNWSLRGTAVGKGEKEGFEVKLVMSLVPLDFRSCSEAIGKFWVKDDDLVHILAKPFWLLCDGGVCISGKAMRDVILMHWVGGGRARTKEMALEMKRSGWVWDRRGRDDGLNTRVRRKEKIRDNDQSLAWAIGLREMRSKFQS